MNLLSRKAQLKFAREGVTLLKHKREVLMSQLMDIVKPLKEKQRQLHSEMVKAFHCQNTARAIDGRGDQALGLCRAVAGRARACRRHLTAIGHR